MKIFLLLFVAAALSGCSHGDETAARPNPDAGLTAQQKIEKIQNDPKIPEGLKRIQTDTLRHEPSLGR